MRADLDIFAEADGYRIRRFDKYNIVIEQSRVVEKIPDVKYWTKPRYEPALDAHSDFLAWGIVGYYGTLKQVCTALAKEIVLTANFKDILQILERWEKKHEQD